jgi:hypothetical protein
MGPEHMLQIHRSHMFVLELLLYLVMCKNIGINVRLLPIKVWH